MKTVLGSRSRTRPSLETGHHRGVHGTDGETRELCRDETRDVPAPGDPTRDISDAPERTTATDDDETRELSSSERPRAQTTTTPREAPPVGVGDTIGRYALLERIGTGGMGIVFAAHDPRLDRRVALKLLRPRARKGSDAREAAARMQREAQAMAQLSHPHVVEVYDVGMAGRRLYIAMELIDGSTVGHWLRADRRPWREVLDVFLQAGRGLAAAHAAGLVHRDFKPSNVLVDRRGHAKVMDFGLALLAGERRLSNLSDASRSSIDPASDSVIDTASSDRLSSPLTEAGVVMGTPAYMAPEQHLGGEVGPSVDQYAFCCALYEGLYGQRPFPGRSAEALFKAKVQGRLRDPGSETRVPAGVRRVIERGLAPEPEERWPSMSALLDALDVAVRPARRRWPLAVGVLGVLLGTWGLLERRGPPCASADERLAGIWDDDRRQAVAAALLRSGTPQAEDQWTRVEAGLDEYAAQWALEVTSHCEAVTAPDAAATSVDRQWVCHQRSLRRLGTVVDVLTEIDREHLSRAMPLVLGLPPPTRCATMDDEGIERMPTDEAAARRVAVLEGHLARVTALGEAGRHATARSLAAEVLADARRLGHAPTELRATLAYANTLMHAGQLEQSAAVLEEGIYAAETVGHDRLVVRMGARLAHVVGHRLRRFEEGMRWARHAEAALARVEDDGRLEAEIRAAVGNTMINAGQGESAVAELEHALGLALAAYGEDSLQTAENRNNLGMALTTVGRYAEANEQYEQVIAVRTRLLGPGNVDIAITMANQAIALFAQGRHDEALATRERVLTMMTESLGPDHPYVGSALNNLGLSTFAQQRLDEAAEYLRRAAAVRARALGPDSPDVAASLVNLGVVLGQQERYDDALVQLHRAEDLLARTVGEEHIWTATCQAAVSNLLYEKGDYELAAVQWQRTLALRMRLHPAGHPDVAFTQRGYAETLVELERWEEARDLLEAALVIQNEGETAPDNLAGTQFLLARALVASGGDEARARALAEHAKAGFETRPERMKEELTELHAWVNRLGPG